MYCVDYYVELYYVLCVCVCRYDFLEVYDGDSERASLVGKYCGKIAPSPITSSGNVLLIKFTSDYETTGAGFSIRYELHRAGLTRTHNWCITPGYLLVYMFTNA